MYHSGIDLSLCPEDIEAFQNKCQIPLFQNQWNRWLLWRSLSDDANKEDLKIYARNAVAWWFKESAALPGLTLGNASNLEVFVNDDEINRELEGKAVNATRIPGVCFPKLKDGPYARVLVKFVYRGARPTIAWPVRKVYQASFIPLPTPSLGVTTKLNIWINACPINADWIMDASFNPVDGEFVPTDTPLFEFGWDLDADKWANKIIGGLAGAIGGAAKKATEPFIPILIGGAVLLLLYGWVRSRGTSVEVDIVQPRQLPSRT